MGKKDYTFKTKKAISSDTIMKNVYDKLCRDFNLQDLPSVRRSMDNLKGDIVAFRSNPSLVGNKYQLDPYRFKQYWQLENFLKRYRFNKDMYSDDALEAITNSKFEDDQGRVASGPIVRTERLHRVIQHARKTVRAILGDLPTDTELFDLGRLPTRATAGSPLEESYSDLKWGTAPVTGSLDHISFLATEANRKDMNKLLYGVLKRNKIGFQICDALATTNVPKSWKSYRGISPDTTTGSYYSSALGAAMTSRLADHGLNIRWLQVKHRKYAKAASKHLNRATTDLKSASQSYGVDTLCMLLPRKWFKAVMRGRVSYTKLGSGKAERTIKLASVMAMGIGFTFPLQTLLFYSLVTAVKELLHVEGRVSVFGDDLIYPSCIHSYVVDVLKQLRFQTNDDKTFASPDIPFRESCGGDYYRGIDVRPFAPEGESVSYTPGNRCAAFLYKLYNGLTTRWDPCEIPLTLRYLEVELTRATWQIYQVPVNYPEYSGIRTSSLKTDWYLPYAPQLYSKDLQRATFMCLTERPGRRFVTSEDVYCWDWLRAAEFTQRPILDRKFLGLIKSRDVRRILHEFPLPSEQIEYGSQRQVLILTKFRYKKPRKGKDGKPKKFGWKAATSLHGVSKFVETVEA
jgi:hypothetical protein